MTCDSVLSSLQYPSPQECVIKNSHKKANRKITDFSDGYVKTRPAEETKSDWEYSVWSGASAQPAAPTVKRKRNAPKKEKSEPKQSKLEQMTLVSSGRFKTLVFCEYNRFSFKSQSTLFFPCSICQIFVRARNLKC